MLCGCELHVQIQIVENKVAFVRQKHDISEIKTRLAIIFEEVKRDLSAW